MEIDRENPLRCIICKDILRQPVILPCGHTVCKTHEIERKEKNEAIYCHECDENHAIPLNGFPVNRMAESMLKRQLHNLDLGEEHAKASNACTELGEFLTKIRLIKQDPESEIHDIVSELKNKIDLRREILIKRIDDEAQQLIDELDQFKRSSLMNHDKIDEFKHSSDLNELFEQIEKECSTWQSELCLFVRKNENWKSIQSKCLTELESLVTEYETFKQHVFDDRLSDFELKQAKYCLDQNEPLLSLSFDVKLKEKMNTFKDNSETFFLYFLNLNKFGIEWKLTVSVPLNDYDDIEIFLYLTSLPKKQTHAYQVKYNLSISARPGFVDQLETEFEHEFRDLDIGWGLNFIQLHELKQNPGLFDQKEQMFTVNALIKSVERIPI